MVMRRGIEGIMRPIASFEGVVQSGTKRVVSGVSDDDYDERMGDGK